LSLDIRPSTSLERSLLFLETLLNTTDKISKVSDNSVVSGVAGGVAKVAGKAEKDIILSISRLFPDNASGSQLDQVALDHGISPRQLALGSSTYVRVTATPGTSYVSSIHKLVSSNGQNFEFEEDFIVPDFGFIYQKIRSLDIGLKTKVDALTISRLTTSPNGHINVINEAPAEGGRDIESDEEFRRRIKEGPNILARGTLSMLEQLFISLNSKVLRLYHHGNDNNGRVILSIATVNGVNLTQPELDSLLESSTKYFTLTEFRPFGSSFDGVILQNIEYQPLDISFRVELEGGVDPDEIRRNIQVIISKYLDPRQFNPSKDLVEWDNLLEIVKNTKGVKYCPDQYFYPRIDIPVNTFMLPRLRGFLMLDLAGSVISNFSGTLSPVYYPNVADFSYAQTVLRLM